MILLTDEQLRDSLLEFGYAVPMLVINTWGSNKVHSERNLIVNRRVQAERWLRFMRREPCARVAHFPQFLALFDINIHRHVAMRCAADRKHA